MIDDEDKIETLKARFEERGVATVKVKDGQIFLFSTEVLKRLISEAKDERVIVFVKTEMVEN